MGHRAVYILAGLVAFSAAATCPALADVYYITYTGSASGTDTNGVFGAAGAMLSSVAFSSTYTYNPSLFSAGTVTNTSTQAAVSGGTAYSPYYFADPFLSASITIGGKSFYQGSSYQGSQNLQTTPQAIETIAFSSPSNYLHNVGYVADQVMLSLTASQAHLLSPGAGSFSYNGEAISLADTYISVTDGPPPTSVPEPTSLALLACSVTMFGVGLGTSRLMRGRLNAMLEGSGAAQPRIVDTALVGTCAA